MRIDFFEKDEMCGDAEKCPMERCRYKLKQYRRNARVVGFPARAGTVECSYYCPVVLIPQEDRESLQNMAECISEQHSVLRDLPVLGNMVT